MASGGDDEAELVSNGRERVGLWEESEKRATWKSGWAVPPPFFH